MKHFTVQERGELQRTEGPFGRRGSCHQGWAGAALFAVTICLRERVQQRGALWRGHGIAGCCTQQVLAGKWCFPVIVFSGK